MAGKFWVACGALLAAAAVAAGAIGAHVLKEVVKLPESQLETYDVAVRYQMYHSLALIAVGVLIGRARSRWLTAAAVAFVTGCVLFSGGIYAWLATDNLIFIRVVPIGGTAWIIGWLLLAVGAITSRAGPPQVT